MRYLAIIILALIFWGCRTQQIITERIVTDSLIIREIPKIVTIEGKTVESTRYNFDSLAKVIQSGVKTEIINRTIYRIDPETNAKIGLLIDELGNIYARCETQEETIELMEREIERYRFEMEKTIEVPKERKSFWQNIWVVLKILAGLFVALIIVEVAKILRR
jgi:hypothetical protein